VNRFVKLMVAFLAIIILLSATFAGVAVVFIGERVLAEAQNRVASDLEAADDQRPEDVHARLRQPLGDVGQAARPIVHVDDDAFAFDEQVAEPVEDLAGRPVVRRGDEGAAEVAGPDAADVADVDPPRSEAAGEMGELSRPVVELDDELPCHRRLPSPARPRAAVPRTALGSAGERRTQRDREGEVPAGGSSLGVAAVGQCRAAGTPVPNGARAQGGWPGAPSL